MDWNKWDEVEAYLVANGKDIPKDIWDSFSVKSTEDYDYLWLKEKRFTEVLLDKNGNPKGTKILFNALQRYFCMVNRMILLEEDPHHLYIYNGKHYEAKQINICDKFLHEEVLDNKDMEGLDPSDFTKFRTNLLAKDRDSKHDLFKRSRGYLNFNNCILDTRTIKTIPHTDELFFKYAINYDYIDDQMETPYWDKLMHFICSGNTEYIRTLEFYIGFMLSMDNTKNFQYFLMLTGGGSNGKGFWLDVLKKMLSPELYTTQKLKKMADDKFGASAMEDKIAIFTDDEDKRVFDNPDFIKELVGGNDTITIERKYRDAYEIEVIAKPILTSNHMPRLPDVSFGFQRRFLIIPLENDTTKVNKSELVIDKEGNKDMFYPEFPSIIRRCLERYHDAKKNGFIVPREIQEHQKKIIKYASQTQTWLNEILVYTGNSDDRIPVRYIYDLYVSDVEKGKNDNKKKIGNFKQDLERWVELFCKKFNQNNEMMICIGEVSNKLLTCKVYLDTEKGILTLLDSVDIARDYNNIKSGRYRDVLIGFRTCMTAKESLESYRSKSSEVEFE